MPQYAPLIVMILLLWVYYSAEVMLGRVHALRATHGQEAAESFAERSDPMKRPFASAILHRVPQLRKRA